MANLGEFGVIAANSDGHSLPSSLGHADGALDELQGTPLLLIMAPFLK